MGILSILGTALFLVPKRVLVCIQPSNQDSLSGFLSNVKLIILIKDKWYQEGENKDDVCGLLRTKGL